MSEESAAIRFALSPVGGVDLLDAAAVVGLLVQTTVRQFVRRSLGGGDENKFKMSPL